MKNIIIFDLDGTLADCSERRAQYEKDGNFEAFEKECKGDKVNFPIVSLYRDLLKAKWADDIPKYRIFIISGRKEKYRRATEGWFLYNDIFCTTLFMRKDDDTRPDVEVKQEMVKYFKGEILFIVDDRKKVVDMWREMGIMCLDCAGYEG